MTDINETELIETTDSAYTTNFKTTSTANAANTANATRIANDAALEERSTAIQKLLSDNGAEVDIFEIKSRLDELISIFKVPAAEAQRSVTNAFLKKYNISKEKVFIGKGAAVTKKIADINEMAQMPDTWINVTGKVIQLWDNHHESITQVGLIGDETGVTKFILWSRSGLNPLELNKVYDFKNAVVKSWNGKVNVDLNRASAIGLSETEITVLRSEAADADKTNEIRKVAELNRDGMWTDLKATVVQLFENTHESIAFAGILGDETGTMRFTAWKTSGIENIEAGKSYLLSNAIIKEWNSNFAAELTRIGKMEESEEIIEVKPAVYEVTGCAVDIQAGSGLIRRCPDCSKVLSKGLCAEHGKVKGKYDLRIKAVFDDGIRAHEAVMNCALTEKTLGISLEDAVLMATETLDPECVNDLIKKEFLGKYYSVRGFRTDRFIIAESVEPAEPVSPKDAGLLRELVEEELKNDSGTGEIVPETEEERNADLEEYERMLAAMDESDEMIEMREPDDMSEADDMSEMNDTNVTDEMNFSGRGVI